MLIICTTLGKETKLKLSKRFFKKSQLKNSPNLVTQSYEFTISILSEFLRLHIVTPLSFLEIPFGVFLTYNTKKQIKSRYYRQVYRSLSEDICIQENGDEYMEVQCTSLLLYIFKNLPRLSLKKKQSKVKTIKPPLV